MFCSQHRVCDPFRVGRFNYPISGVSLRSTPANFSHPSRMTDSVSRSTLRATDALDL